MLFIQSELDMIARARETEAKSFSQAWDDGEGEGYFERELMARMFEAMQEKHMVEAHCAHQCKICERAEGPCLFAGMGKRGRVFRCGEFKLAQRYWLGEQEWRGSDEQSGTR